ncbi:ribonuclease domain-containing protein [Kutzneria sp. CA-103260]|uniref:ribonuclease domain-containing protein n=1 Tax=Kutzneria sp. CA-103260 TaxID=2802641 RepID=UPI001BAAD4D9|nr:ribonuclease domain-containing protein [Kutzneria sp. CA-103260]QUQ63814.1 ribonuclease [Kutzneria sp. CA-103260]
MKHRPRTTWAKRLTLTVAALLPLLGLTLVAAPAASATVYNSCTISGCSAASSANSTWQSMGYPSQRGWYDWPNGQCSYAGGTYYNDDNQLPSGDSFQEFDVYPRSCGAHRDAARIVVDMDNGEVWFSPDHYSDFYQL